MDFPLLKANNLRVLGFEKIRDRYAVRSQRKVPAKERWNGLENKRLR